MPRMNPTVARLNEETLNEAREFGDDARIEIVQVTHGDKPHQCTAVWRYRDRKFPLAELPELPLTDCESEECDCTYVLALPLGP